MYIQIGREKQYAWGVLCGVNFLLCRLLQPVTGFFGVRNQQSAVPVQHLQKVLRVCVTRFSQLRHLCRSSIPFCKRQFFIFNRSPQLPSHPGEFPVIYQAATILHVLVRKENLVLLDALGLLDQ